MSIELCPLPLDSRFCTKYEVLKKIVYYLLICSCLLAIGCKASKKDKVSTKDTTNTPKKPPRPKSLFNFEKSPTLSAVLDKAEKVQKPVFVDFYTTWCTPCKMMEEDIFTDKNLANYYNRNFVIYKVDCEKGNGANLAAIYGINNYPTLLFLDVKGNILLRHESAAYHSKMQQLGDEALLVFKNKGTN